MFNIQAQNNPQQLLDKFFSLYQKEGSASALDYLFSSNIYLSQNQDGLEKIKQQLQGLIDVIGAYKDFELHDQNNFGSNFQMYRYVVRYQRQPLLFTFILYRPDNEWLFQNFLYDPNLDELLKQMSKK